MQKIFYLFIKVYISTGLFFYAKRIKVSGRKNIPKKGAVLFMANHPNGLVDPLIIATSIKRKTHFLVQAAVFKKPTIAKIFGWLGMMPIYRIRDGIKQLSKNETIFTQCENLLKNQKAILIFPEGSHNRKRTIRPLSKGFTRILFRTLEKYKDLEIRIIPVGMTYQNASFYPANVTVNFGKPILASSFYNADAINESIKQLKTQVSKQLKELSVHIANDENYAKKLEKLNNSQINFTDVEKVNWMLQNNKFLPAQKPKKELKLLKFVVILNSIFPFLIWKKASKKIPEIEFVDTFKFGLNLVLFPLFYSIQTLVVSYFFGKKIGLIYFVISLFLVFIYTKLSPTNTEVNKQV